MLMRGHKTLVTPTSYQENPPPVRRGQNGLEEHVDNDSQPTYGKAAVNYNGIFHILPFVELGSERLPQQSSYSTTSFI
jgi:hypothetical protein